MKEKLAAYRAVRTAIERGQLVRPTNCGQCGIAVPPCADGRSGIHAHHHDYSKPLDVEWVCAKCHRKETPFPAKPGAPVFGQSNGQAKLNDTEVLSARRLRSAGLSYSKIAERFGVQKTTVMRAIKGEHWSHVAAAPAAPGGAQ